MFADPDENKQEISNSAQNSEIDQQLVQRGNQGVKEAKERTMNILRKINEMNDVLNLIEDEI